MCLVKQVNTQIDTHLKSYLQKNMKMHIYLLLKHSNCESQVNIGKEKAT